MEKKYATIIANKRLEKLYSSSLDFLWQKLPKKTGTGNTHDSSVHEEHVSCLSITAMTGCRVFEGFLQFLDFSTIKKQQMAENVNLIQGKN